MNRLIIAKAFTALGVVAAIGLQPYRVFVVDGPSMEPTYADHSVLMYRPVGALRRGMVVLFRHGGSVRIKRIAGLPGDGVPSINGDYPLSQHFLDSRRATWTKLGKDEIWVMSDNLNQVTDSRAIGPVKISDVIGEPCDQRSDGLDAFGGRFTELVKLRPYATPSR